MQIHCTYVPLDILTVIAKHCCNSEVNNLYLYLISLLRECCGEIELLIFIIDSER